MEPTKNDHTKQPKVVARITESWGDRYGYWAVGATAFLLLLLLVVFKVSH